MARLILLLFALAALLWAVGYLMSAVARVAQSPLLSTTGDRAMPPFVQKMSYAALVILMFMSASGALENF